MNRQSWAYYTSARSSVLQDTLLSCLGSVFACLLVRWVSGPAFGFTRHILTYVGSALVLTLIGLVISGSVRVISRYASFWAGERILLTVLLKETGLAVLMVTGVTGIPAPVLLVLTVVTDALFSIALMLYPRILISRMREEDKSMKDLSTRANALVAGDDDNAAQLAESAARSGRYNVLGLLSRKPEMGGKVLGEHIIYYVPDDRAMEALQWRLGGIDCILFPKAGPGGMPSSGDGSGDAEDPAALQQDKMNAAGKLLKRGFDIALSGLLLVLFSPLIAACALAVRLEDGTPVIYAQERLGRGGKPFRILKFRTMRRDAEEEGVPQLYAGDDDPRLTRVGHFLRIHHLDELPQLWNVLRGDMSFIGYRPERKYFIDRIMAVNPRYRYLYQIRPGVTSYATLYNGYTDTLEKMLTRLDLDLYYLRNHSVWFDVRVLGLTFLRIVGGKKF